MKIAFPDEPLFTSQKCQIRCNKYKQDKAKEIAKNVLQNNQPEKKKETQPLHERIAAREQRIGPYLREIKKEIKKESEETEEAEELPFLIVSPIRQEKTDETHLESHDESSEKEDVKILKGEIVFPLKDEVLSPAHDESSESDDIEFLKGEIAFPLTAQIEQENTAQPSPKTPDEMRNEVAGQTITRTSPVSSSDDDSEDSFVFEVGSDEKDFQYNVQIEQENTARPSPKTPDEMRNEVARQTITLTSPVSSSDDESEDSFIFEVGSDEKDFQYNVQDEITQTGISDEEVEEKEEVINESNDGVNKDDDKEPKKVEISINKKQVDSDICDEFYVKYY